MAVKRIMRYLNGTRSVGITLGGKREPELVMYADASYADDEIDRRSTSAYLAMFNGPIAWKSKRQATIALSTTEAEIAALTAAGSGRRDQMAPTTHLRAHRKTDEAHNGL